MAFRSRYSGLAIIATACLPVLADDAPDPEAIDGRIATVVDSIRTEVLRDVSDRGLPLPLASTWHIGKYHHLAPDRPQGPDPAWQLEQIEKGHRFLPAFHMPDYQIPISEEKFVGYTMPTLEKLRDHRLPFVLLGSQWERALTDNAKYFDLPPDQNPNVVTPEGEILKMVDPFGPTELWYEVGKMVASHPAILQMQEVYPSPPKVIFLSNNEHAKLYWHEVEKSQRYLEKYGEGKPDQFKRKVVGDAWIEKYRELQRGMRDGLIEKNWKKNAIFVGYGGDIGMEAMGRWGNWETYSLHTPGRISLAPYMWDGVSPSYYMHNWAPVSDYQVWSTQIEAMNTVFALKEAYEINPSFWYELSIWDGDSDNETRGTKAKLTVFREAGQTYDMQRFRGWLQFGQWLMRPRILRLYENWIDPLEEIKEKFDNINMVVARVHENETLRSYWQTGTLVPNRKSLHPYQSNLPNEVQIQQRWFLLDADVNPERPWTLETEIPVFSLALVKGDAPNRTWLVYAHAPLRDYEKVEIDIPEWKTITIDVPREGAFYEVREADGSMERIEL